MLVGEYRKRQESTDDDDWGQSEGIDEARRLEEFGSTTGFAIEEWGDYCCPSLCTSSRQLLPRRGEKEGEEKRT